MRLFLNSCLERMAQAYDEWLADPSMTTAPHSPVEDLAPVEAGRYRFDRMAPRTASIGLLLMLALGCGEAGETRQELAPRPQLATPERHPPTQPSAQLASIGRQTPVHARPSSDSATLGLLRAGTVVDCTSAPSKGDGCSGKWCAIQPRGHVCVDDAAATFDVDHPIVSLAAGSSARARQRAASSVDEAGNADGLPFRYALARYPTPPLYGRLPSEDEQRQREPDLDEHLRDYAKLQRQRRFVPPPATDALPPLLAGRSVLPGLDGVDRGVQWDLGRARRRSGFALLASFQHTGRRFGLTTDLQLIPLDRTRMTPAPRLRGVRLGDGVELPVAFVTSTKVRRYRRRGRRGVARMKGSLPHRTALNLTGEELRTGKHAYLEVDDGSFVRADQVMRVDRFRKAPAWAKRGDKWIDISIVKQTLVAYEGLEPRLVTLISTGRDGLARHDDSFATIQGTFLIHTKHVSHTMDSDSRAERFRLADVPFVQYFKAGFALHGAYWHDDFGEPRSHGCINLSPPDAQWLFEWTAPEVPAKWHAALSPDAGTLVHIHP